MTLVELLLALAILSVVSGTVTMMLFSLSQGMETRRDLRRHNIKALVVGQRLDTALRSASAVLACSDRSVVLWLGDLRSNQKPDLSELCRIEWDAQGQQLLSYTAPLGLAEAEDRTYDPASTDFAAITAALMGTSQFPGIVCGNGVVAAQFRTAGPLPTARVLSYDVTFDGQQETYTIASTIALRGQLLSP